MAQVSDVATYKIARGILFGVFVINITLIFTAIVMYIDAAVKLKTQQEIGKRQQQQCGHENTEKETERYYIYNAFIENKLSLKVTKAIQLLYATLGLTLTGVAVAYFFWMISILYESKSHGLNAYKVSWNEKLAKFVGKMAFWVRDKSIIPGANMEEKIISGSRWWVGWLLYAAVFVLLLLGAVASWLQAAGVKQYQVDTISTDVTKTVDDVKNELDQTMSDLKSKIPGISSPWFSIVLIISYGAVWVWLTKDMTDKDGLVVKRVDKLGVLLWITILLLYFFAIFVAQVMNANTRGVFAAINGSYTATKTKVQEYIQALFKTEATKVAGTGEKNRVAEYFKTWIEAVTPGTEVDLIDINGNGTGQYSGQLWKFLQHRSGKEMEELYERDPTNVNLIRKYALELRVLAKPIRDLTNKFTRNAIIIAMVLITTLLFVTFNLFCHLWSSTGMVVGSLLVILVFAVLSTWFGWFSSALML